MASLYCVMKAWWLAVLLLSLRCNAMSRRSVVDDSPEVFSGVVSEDGEQLQRVKEEFLGSAKDSKRILGISTTSEAALTSLVVQEYDGKMMIGFRNHVDSITATPSSPEYYGRKILSFDFDNLISDEAAEGINNLVDDLEQYVIDNVSKYVDVPLMCIVRNNTELVRETAEDTISELFECVLKGEGNLEDVILSIDFEKYVTINGTAWNMSTLVDDVEEYIMVNVSEFADGMLLMCNVSNTTELVHEAEDSIIEIFDCVMNGEDTLHALTEFLNNTTQTIFGDTVFGDTIDDIIEGLDIPQEHDGRKMMLGDDVKQIVGDIDDVNNLLDDNQGGTLDDNQEESLDDAQNGILDPRLKGIVSIIGDDLNGVVTDIITGNLFEDGGTVEKILGSIFALECLNDTTSKLEEDENYVAKNLSQSMRKFYEVVSDLPNVGNLDDDSLELATYVAIISGGSLFIFLCLIVGVTVLCRKMCRKREEGKMESTHDSTPLLPPLWPEVLLFFFSLATAVVVGVGLNFIHKQASEGTNQINDLADYLVITVQEVQEFFIVVRTVTMNVITTNLEGFLGCLTPTLVGPAVDEASGLINSTIDDLEGQLPYTDLLELADEFYDAADIIDSTVNARIAVVLAFTIISIVAVFCAGLEYALARSKLNSYKGIFSCCKAPSGCVAFCRKTLVYFICVLAIIGSCTAFGGSAGLLHLISTNCLDPEQTFIDMLPSDSVAARQALEFYLTCQEQEGHIDIESFLYQSRCIISRMQGSILPRFCLEGDVSEMEHDLKELNSLTHRVTNRLSCSKVNPLYVDLVHNNICGDVSTWSIVVLCTSLAYTFFIFFFCWKCYTDRRCVKDIILANTRNADEEKQAQKGGDGSNRCNTAEEGDGRTDDGNETEDGKGKVGYAGETSFSPYG